MRYCNCIPWDYPTPANINDTNDGMICDFYGKSCFNSYIENGFAENCTEKCLEGCNEVIFSLTTDREPIHPGDICNYDPNDDHNDLSAFEIKTASYIRNSSYSKNQGVIRFIQALAGKRNSTSFMLEYCTKRVRYDIAIVNVVMESPTVIKYRQVFAASYKDKIGIFGECRVLKQS